MSPNWFVAWPLSGATEWLTRLEASAPGGLDFLDPADLHVTLAFLGRYEPSLSQKLLGLIEACSIPQITVSPGELVALPQPRRFSSLAFLLGLGRSAAEQHISKWGNRLCHEIGARIETRPPLPHFTIARPLRRIGESDRDTALEWIGHLPTERELTLSLEPPRIYTWADRNSSRRYRILA